MNRDAAINTFEGGLDLDSDIRLVPQNKMRDSVNTDIRRSEDVAVLVDLKGETIKTTLEDLSSVNEISILAACDETFFLIEPTLQKIKAIVFFYIRRTGSSMEFVIKSLFLSTSTLRTLYVEELTQNDFDLLKDSTIDFEKSGQFGYDTIYFVDNRRQPRKLECLIDRVNDNSLTLLLDEVNDSTGYKSVVLDVVNTGSIGMPFRAYIYAYKLGGPTRPTTINPNTDTIKFVDFLTTDTIKQVSFDIHQEDYGNWVFQIVYHRESTVYYRNFVIGDPFKVDVAIGVLEDSLPLIASTSLTPSVNQLNSWNFLYEGGIITVYKTGSTTEFEVGDNVYSSQVASPSNYLPNGFYQVPDENTYVEVNAGQVVGTNINNWNVVVQVTPIDIEADVLSAATVVTDGVKNRLTVLDYEFADDVTVDSELFDFVSITAGSKSSTNPTWSFTLERPEEVVVDVLYISSIVGISASSVSVVPFGDDYNVTIRATLTRTLSDDVFVDVKMKAIDSGTGDLLPDVEGTVFIQAGDLTNQTTILYTLNTGPANFVNACVDDVTYSGPESYTITNPCSV